MKMVIVLDKVLLVGVIAVSFYAGYKAGTLATDVKKTLDNIQPFDVSIGKEQ